MLFKKEKSNYALYGALFGLCFPVIACLIDAAHTLGAINVDNIVSVQISNPLMWIIDSAPLWLGWFASFAGRRQDKLIKIIAER